LKAVEQEHPRYGKQRKLTRYIVAHPYLGALWSGLALAGWVAVIVGDWRAIAASFIGMFLITVFLWRPGGPARRREDRLFPKSEQD
jgi:hypothetical protein